MNFLQCVASRPIVGYLSYHIWHLRTYMECQQPIAEIPTRSSQHASTHTHTMPTQQAHTYSTPPSTHVVQSFILLLYTYVVRLYHKQDVYTTKGLNVP